MEASQASYHCKNKTTLGVTFVSERMAIYSLKRRLQRLFGYTAASADDPEDAGEALVDGIGHRDYVGGHWEAIGSVQFRFLVDHGLDPQHVFLDVGCGSLRAGVRLIPYLDAGNYLGIDNKHELIDAGIKNELGEKLYRLKRPEFVTSETFEFSRFSKQPDFAIAQAVFPHLPEELIILCLRNLRAHSKAGTKFYATYGETPEPKKMVLEYHPYLAFGHTRDQMLDFGERTGWKPRYIGDWNHPRRQMMVEYSI